MGTGDTSTPSESAPTRRYVGLAGLAVLALAGPDHPWPDIIIANRFGNSRDRTTLTKVARLVVAEVTADTGLQGGVWRHPLRFIRYRPEPTADDVAAAAVPSAAS